ERGGAMLTLRIDQPARDRCPRCTSRLPKAGFAVTDAAGVTQFACRAHLAEPGEVAVLTAPSPIPSFTKECLMLTNLMTALFVKRPAPAVKPVAAPAPSRQPFKVEPPLNHAEPSLHCPEAAVHDCEPNWAVVECD